MPLSQKQMEYLALAWQCFESEPKIDYEKFRQVANLASAHSARELMRVTKKKLKEEYGALNGVTSPSTPKKVGGGGGANGLTEKGGTPETGGKGGRKKKATTPAAATPGTGKRGRTKKNTPVPESVASEAASDGEEVDGGDEQMTGRKAKKVKVEPELAHGLGDGLMGDEEDVSGVDMFQLW